MQTKPNDVLTSWLNRNESINFLQLGFLFPEIWWKHVPFRGRRRKAKTNKQINKWSIYVLSYFASVEVVGGKEGGRGGWMTDAPQEWLYIDSPKIDTSVFVCRLKFPNMCKFYYKFCMWMRTMNSEWSRKSPHFQIGWHLVDVLEVSCYSLVFVAAPNKTKANAWLASRETKNCCRNSSNFVYDPFESDIRL